MKPRVRISVFAIFAVVVASAAACSNKHAPTGSSGASQVSLHPTVATQVSGNSLTLLRVDNDSRCSVDVTCVWAGNATVVFTITFAGQVGVLPAQQFLNTTVEPRSLVLNGYSFRLDSLLPRPVSTHTITQGEYVAYMTVRQMLD